MSMQTFIENDDLYCEGIASCGDKLYVRCTGDYEEGTYEVKGRELVPANTSEFIERAINKIGTPREWKRIEDYLLYNGNAVRIGGGWGYPTVHKGYLYAYRGDTSCDIYRMKLKPPRPTPPCIEEVVLEVEGVVKEMFLHPQKGDSGVYVKVVNTEDEMLYRRVGDEYVPYKKKAVKTVDVYKIGEEAKRVDENEVKGAKRTYLDSTLPKDWEIIGDDTTVLVMGDTYMNLNNKMTWALYHNNCMYGYEKSRVVRVRL